MWCWAHLRRVPLPRGRGLEGCALSRAVARAVPCLMGAGGIGSRTLAGSAGSCGGSNGCPEPAPGLRASFFEAQLPQGRAPHLSTVAAGAGDVGVHLYVQGGGVVWLGCAGIQQISGNYSTIICVPGGVLVGQLGSGQGSGSVRVGVRVGLGRVG